ncbi:MAG: amino acid adenylation domain-containing protein [Bacteroidetes bacterium]|nr:amino acid adenylation domain-containing protein [Bacteroidota bacterium]
MKATTSYLNIEAVQAHENVEARDYWNDQMKGVSFIPCFDRCITGTSNDIQTNNTDRIEFTIPVSIKDKLHAVAPSAKAVHVLLLGAMGLLASRFTMAGDPVIFTVDPDQDDNSLDTASLLPLRISAVQSMSGREYLVAMREQFVNAVNHARYPLSKKLQLTTDQIQAVPVIAAMPFHFAGADSFAHLTPGLILYYETVQTGLLVFQYNTALFSKVMIHTLAQSYLQLLTSMLSDMNARTDSYELIGDVATKELLARLDNIQVAWPRNETLVSLIEKQAALLPDNIAITFEQSHHTYRAINARANQFAAMLREQGIAPNQVVGLLMDRNVEMLVAMLGILKAGGAYLPIDPDYPVDRKNYLVEDSQTACVVTTRAASVGLQQSNLFLYTDEMDLGRYGTENPPAVNTPDDLCYIIYTSGTTGNPKGVMISHYNVVRLLFNDQMQFDFSEADVWTMFHSHCFDFSVWEIFGAFCYGSRLIIIPKMIARDTEAFLQLLRDEKVTILNQTPSAFYNLVQEELTSAIHTLSLRYVIFGGEALSPAKLLSWRQHYPLVKLINMFGITETTVHVTYKEIGAYEIEHNISNIGTPIPTLAVYIMDSFGKLLPAGCAGELYVGGAGVAKGYLGKEELTQQKFITHPYIAGERVYRSGDLARMLLSGDLEYLGRMDEQVKIRGFRIELGEIEYQLSHYPGVQKCAVIAREEDGQKYLAGYFVADTPLPGTALREYLQAQLPDYMVPSFLVQLAAIPLTSNGKLDRRSLPAPKAAITDDYVAPEGIKETTLCAVWQKVLGLERIGVTDNFFSAGGDSIKSIQIISRMRAEGYELSVKDIFTQQTIRSLASTMRERHAVSDQSEISGAGLLSPVQSWFFSTKLQHTYHFNQSILLEFPEGISFKETERIFTQLQAHHDALRMVFTQQGAEWKMETLPAQNFPVRITEVDLLHSGSDTAQTEYYCNLIQSSVDISTGPLMRMGLFTIEQGNLLLIVIHHLVVDGISWRILLEDIDILLGQIRSEKPVSLPPKTDSFHQWSLQLEQYRHTRDYKKAIKYWEQWTASAIWPSLPAKSNNTPVTISTKRTVTAALNAAHTNQFLKQIHDRFGTGPDDILLTALQMSLERMFGVEKVCIALEGHGREEVIPGINISRTVGWFTSIYPVCLSRGDANELLNSRIKRTKELIRKIPNKGFDYLLWKFSNEQEALRESSPEVCFNYLGQFDTDTKATHFRISGGEMGEVQSLQNELLYKWEVAALVSGGELRLVLGYSDLQYDTTDAEQLLQLYKANLETLIDYCIGYEKNELTPADLSYGELSAEELEQLQQQYDVEDVYPLSPLQEGLYFHSQVDEHSDTYFEQISFTWEGPLNMDAVQLALQQLAERYSVLRTAFVHIAHPRPLQVVVKHTTLTCRMDDIRGEMQANNREELLQQYRTKDRSAKFDTAQPGLMRVWILRTGEETWEFLWSHHHIIMDGWCMGLVIRDFGILYQAECRKQPIALPPVKHYGEYIRWLERNDREQSAIYWQNYLQGYDKAIVFPQRDQQPEQTESTQQQSVKFSPGRDVTGKIHALCAHHAVTPNIVLQTVWGLLASKYNNTGDVVFGVVVSGRPGELEGVEQMVGLFINTIPVRVQYNAGDTVVSLMTRIREEALQSEPYHYHSLAAIMQESEAGRNLVSHILVFENYPVEQEIQSAQAQGENLYRVTNAAISEYTNYPLAVLITPGEDFRIEIQYNSHVYAHEKITVIKEHFLHILQQVLEHPERHANEIQLITAGEEEQILKVFNNTATAFPDQATVVDLFEEQVVKTPHNMAFVYKDQSTSYLELSLQSAAVAEYLRNKCHVQPGDLVGVLMTRNEYLIPVLFGILKAGAAYVPADPSFPKERIEVIFKDAAVRAIIASENPVDLILPANCRVVSLNSTWKEILAMKPVLPAGKHDAIPGNLAYVIYTSGTTGKPKGVMIEHRSLVNRLCWMQKKYPLQDKDVLIQKTPLVFDVSVWELFWWSQTGAGLCMPEPGAEKFPEQINEAIAAHNVSVIHFVPSMLSEYMSDLTVQYDYASIKSLQRVFVSGESIRTDQVSLFGETLFKHIGTALINLYGPTEATVDVSYYDCDFQETIPRNIPIGKPVYNTTLIVCDRNMQLMPVGVTGELCIGGVGLARGYLNNPESTYQKFRNHYLGNEQRYYCTGDLARWLPDGNIEYLGRLDHQVKVRGFRIETDEIEFALSAIAGIKRSHVIAKGKDKEKWLCAYYAAEKAFDSNELRHALMQTLPSYMIPAFFVHVNEFPLSPNGKLDRNALPDPMLTSEIQSPQTFSELELQLLEIWGIVLRTDPQKISIHANFFEVGGDSIRILNLKRLINTTMSLQVTAADVFRHPTIASFASFLNGHNSNQEAYQEELSREADEMNDAINLFTND